MDSFLRFRMNCNQKLMVTCGKGKSSSSSSGCFASFPRPKPQSVLSVRKSNWRNAYSKLFLMTLCVVAIVAKTGGLSHQKFYGERVF